MAGSSLPVGIIGAGPAGATLARLLAAGGIRALLIDERGPHEKTCGGGVTRVGSSADRSSALAIASGANADVPGAGSSG